LSPKNKHEGHFSQKSHFCSHFLSLFSFHFSEKWNEKWLKKWLKNATMSDTNRYFIVLKIAKKSGHK